MDKQQQLLDELYASVVEEFSSSRQADMARLVAMLMGQPEAIDPEAKLVPVEDAQQALTAVDLASFISMRSFCKKFPTEVVDTLTTLVAAAREEGRVSYPQASQLIEKLSAWISRICPLFDRLLAAAVACNADFAKFCIRARISDCWRRADLFSSASGFDVQQAEATLAAVEMDIEVCCRIMESDVLSVMFGGDALVVKNGRTRVVDDGAHIKEMI